MTIGNTFGNIFRVTTFGESHGTINGAVIDGLPSGLTVKKRQIMDDLMLRRPGREYTSKRNEDDTIEIVSGLFNDRTTGSPLTILIPNRDVDSSYYEKNKYYPRPGHADLPAIMKYGFDNWDYRGGGRFSARETVARVAAGAVARKLLLTKGIMVVGCVSRVGGNEFKNIKFEDCLKSRKRELRTPSDVYENSFRESIKEAVINGDSIGGSVTIFIKNVPPGIGDPVFNKVKANLASAMMSIPGSTYFEIGEGRLLSNSHGTEVMDAIYLHNGKYTWEKNYAGGILGGITTGDEIFFHVGFKPTSSIPRNHRTVDLRTNKETQLRIVGRHDPSIIPRAVSVAESMTCMVMLDQLMLFGEMRKPIREDENNLAEDAWKMYAEARLR